MRPIKETKETYKRDLSQREKKPIKETCKTDLSFMSLLEGERNKETYKRDLYELYNFWWMYVHLGTTLSELCTEIDL